MTKELEGRQWKDDDVFTFRIAAVTEGAPMPAELTATATKSNPVAVFGSISYDTVGVYEYDITEDKVSDDIPEGERRIVYVSRYKVER